MGKEISVGEMHVCGRMEWYRVDTMNPNTDAHSTTLPCRGTVLPVNAEKTKWKCSACGHITQ